MKVAYVSENILRLISIKNIILVLIGVLIAMPAFVFARNRILDEQTRFWTVAATCLFVEKDKVAAIGSSGDITTIIDNAIASGRCSANR